MRIKEDALSTRLFRWNSSGSLGSYEQTNLALYLWEGVLIDSHGTALRGPRRDTHLSEPLSFSSKMRSRGRQGTYRTLH